MKKTMLRIVSTFAALTTLCAGSALHASAAETDAPVLPDRIMGDITGDCRVNLYDCLAAAEYYGNSLLGLNGEEADDTVYPADIDMDGKITLSDLLAMNEHYALEMLGIHPLWADLREVSYADGSEHYSLRTDGSYSPAPTHYTLTGMYLEIGCAFGKPGEEVEVPVYIAGADALVAFQYRQSVPAGYAATNGVVNIAGKDDLTFFNPTFNDNACLVWAAEDAENVDITDGKIIATVTYRIPEDAQPGDTQIISADTAYNMFTCITGEGQNTQIEMYQYTAVSGVIAVE